MAWLDVAGHYGDAMRRPSENLRSDAAWIDVATGLFAGARQVPSPNCDDRPPGVEPDLIVVHGISLPPGDFGGEWIDLFFTNRLPADAHPYFASIAGMRVSSHLLIRRHGELVQYVSLGRRAWHAGQSSYRGRPACNDYSVGIELEGTDASPYEPAQYRRLADVVLALCVAYPTLSTTRIAGHDEVAPGRKTDPGPAFDWPLLRTLLVTRGGTPS